MAQLYADENFDYRVVVALRAFGHDVLTAQEAGQANQRIPDEEVLAFAAAQQRAVLTFNRRHFIRLHAQNATHPGIVVCTRDDDVAGLAVRIHQTIAIPSALDNRLIRVNRE